MTHSLRTFSLSLFTAALLLVPYSSHARTQVSNLAEPLEVGFTADGTHFAHASSFTTDGSSYTLESIAVSVFTNYSGSAELRLRADGGGFPGLLIESLGTQALLSNQGNVFLTYYSSGTLLNPNTTYWVTLGETGSGDLSWDGTWSTAEYSPGSWTIGDEVKVSDDGGATWQDTIGLPNGSAKFSVRDTSSRCNAVPTVGCKTAIKASLQIKDDATDNTKDRLKWRWIKGEQVDQVELGSPATLATYTLCIYDSTAGVDALATEVTINPNTGWQDKDPKGWNYKDTAGLESGVQKAQLKTGAADKAKAQVKARGVNLTPVLPLPVSGTELFAQDPRVTVQLINSEPVTCWTSEFLAATKNTPRYFKAKQE